MPELRSALYDFSVSPYSYDFLAFICQARAAGCNHTVFVPGEREYQKCSPEEQAFRLEHLLIPLARMSGEVTVCKTREEAKAFQAVFPFGYTTEKPIHGHMFGQLIRSQKARWLTPSAQSLSSVPSGRLTITIRESRIKPLRNSNIGQWTRAAERLKDMGYRVLFVPDTDNMQCGFGDFDIYPEASLDPEVRLALYSKSVLNLGIGNGPMGLAFYSSKIPYLMFRMHDERFNEQSAAFMKANNLPIGSQAPWRGNNQALVWEEDTEDNIIKHVQRWELRKAA
jgi:hypothetical protein